MANAKCLRPYRRGAIRHADTLWRNGGQAVTMAVMAEERLLPVIPEQRHSGTSREMFVEQLRQIAMYVQTAAVLEAQGERSRPSPGSDLLRACARRRRERAAEIRASLTPPSTVWGVSVG